MSFNCAARDERVFTAHMTINDYCTRPLCVASSSCWWRDGASGAKRLRGKRRMHSQASVINVSLCTYLSVCLLGWFKVYQQISRRL